MKKKILLSVLCMALCVSMSACTGANANNINESTVNNDEPRQSEEGNAATDAGETEEADDNTTSVSESDALAIDEVAGDTDIEANQPVDMNEITQEGSVFPTTLEDAEIAASTFLMLEVEGTKAIISEDFHTDEDLVMIEHHSGEVLSFIELLNMVKEKYLSGDNEDEMPEISYAFIDNSGLGNYSFAVKFGDLEMSSQDDGNYAIYVFQLNGDALYLTYSGVYRTKHPMNFNKYGYVRSLGSAEEGALSYNEGVITRYGRYEYIFDSNESSGTWTINNLDLAAQELADNEEISRFVDDRRTKLGLKEDAYLAGEPEWVQVR